MNKAALARLYDRNAAPVIMGASNNIRTTMWAVILGTEPVGDTVRRVHVRVTLEDGKQRIRGVLTVLYMRRADGWVVPAMGYGRPVRGRVASLSEISPAQLERAELDVVQSFWPGSEIGESAEVEGALLGARVRAGSCARIGPGAVLGEGTVVSDHSRTR